MSQIKLNPAASTAARRRFAEAQSERECQFMAGVKGEALISPIEEAVRAYIEADPLYRAAPALLEALRAAEGVIHWAVDHGAKSEPVLKMVRK